MDSVSAEDVSRFKKYVEQNKDKAVTHWPKFCGWHYKEHRDAIWGKYRKPVTKLEVYDMIVEMVETLADCSIEKLSDVLDGYMRPAFPLGKCDGYRYRLVPRGTSLDVNEDEPYEELDDRRPMVWSIILSLYEDLNSRIYGTIGSEDSPEYDLPKIPRPPGGEKPPEPNTEHPLIFAQLGPLQYQYRDEEWRFTPFVVVINLFTQQPWLIYNSRAYDDETDEAADGETFHGCLPHDPERPFSIARLRAGPSTEGLDVLRLLLLGRDLDDPFTIDEHFKTPDRLLLLHVHRGKDRDTLARRLESAPLVKRYTKGQGL